MVVNCFFKEEKKYINIFSQILLFFYFFSLHADQLNYHCYGVTIRLNNLIAFILGSYVFYLLKERIIFSKKMFFALITLIFSVAISWLINPISFRSVFFYFGLFSL